MVDRLTIRCDLPLGIVDVFKVGIIDAFKLGIIDAFKLGIIVVVKLQSNWGSLM